MRSLLTAPRGITLARDLPAVAIARRLGRYATSPLRGYAPLDTRNPQGWPVLGRYATSRLRGLRGLGQWWDLGYDVAAFDDGGYYDDYGLDWNFYGDSGGGGGDLFATETYYGGDLAEPDPWGSFFEAWFPGETYYVEVDPYAFDPFQTQDVPFETQFVEPASDARWDNDQFWQDFATGGVPTYGYVNWNGEDLLFDLSDPGQAQQYEAISNYQLSLETKAEIPTSPTPIAPTSALQAPKGEGNWFTNLIDKIFGGSASGKTLPGAPPSAPKPAAPKPPTAPKPTTQPGVKPPSWFEQQSMVSGIPNWAIVAIAGGGLLLLRRK